MRFGETMFGEMRFGETMFGEMRFGEMSIGEMLGNPPRLHNANEQNLLVKTTQFGRHLD